MAASNTGGHLVLGYAETNTAATTLQFGPFSAGTLIKALHIVASGDLAATRFEFRIHVLAGFVDEATESQMTAGRPLTLLSPLGGSRIGITVAITSVSFPLYLNHVIEPGLPIIAVRVGANGGGTARGVISVELG